MDNPLDIRLVELEVNVIPAMTEYELEMTCPARMSVSQPIPIINKSGMDYNMKCELKVDNDAKCFTGSGDLTVRRGATDY